MLNFLRVKGVDYWHLFFTHLYVHNVKIMENKLLYTTSFFKGFFQSFFFSNNVIYDSFCLVFLMIWKILDKIPNDLNIQNLPVMYEIFYKPVWVCTCIICIIIFREERELL